MVRAAVFGGLLGFLVATSTPLAADEDEAAVLFDLLFAPEVAKAKATRGYEDDLSLALELRMAAAGEDDPDMAELLCQNTFELAQRTPKGYPLAVGALEAIKKHNSARAAECDESILAIRRKQCSLAGTVTKQTAAANLVKALTAVADAKASQGDHTEELNLLGQAVRVASAAKLDSLKALQEKLKVRTAQGLANLRIEAYKAKLKADPKDEYSRGRLVMLYLVEKDDPATAAKYLSAASAETLRTYVPLAVKDPAGLAPQVCGELGLWYAGLGGSASAPARSAMLTRAQGYLRAFIQRGGENDANMSRARLQLARIEKELKPTAPSGVVER